MPAERSERIEQLYHAARERDPDQRAAFLQQACTGDEALRREVESLLAEDGRVESFLEMPALELARKMHSEEASQSLIGRQLGSYQVLSLLGEGGMGEVYCARDTKLDREVALKVLPASFARDPERLARFRREARLLASLNHPNIAAIYGIEEFDGLHCLAMELVPGETLAGAGPLPLENALTICRQLAEGLEEAHRKNITHRDIKPANIKVTPEGLVKILDFGLAKALAWEQPGMDLSDLPSASGVATQEGRILGTPAYMSPEQVRGKTVEKQSDIWAFGCVLYELLTGRHAFQGETFTDTISTILTQEPDWQALPPATSAKVRELLRRCLKKDAKRRLQDVGDARIEIEEALAVAGTTTTSSERTVTAVHLPAAGISPVRSRTPRRWAIFAGLGWLVAVIASLAVWNLKPPPSSAPLSVNRFMITLPAGQVLAGPDQPALALSPDGSRLVYAASTGGVQQLYLRAMDSLEAKPIAGTEGAAAPFFSPDGQWVGFFASQKLQKVSISGGAVATISGRPYAGGASWGSQGMIAFAPRINSSLQQVPEAGGAAQLLTRLDNGEHSHLWPEFLPGGKALLFVASPNPGDLPTLVCRRLGLPNGRTWFEMRRSHTTHLRDISSTRRAER